MTSRRCHSCRDFTLQKLPLSFRIGDSLRPMKSTGLLSLIALVVISVAVFCCDRSENRQWASERDELKGEIRVLDNENTALKRQHSKLQTEFIRLQSEHDNLKVKASDLAQWSQHLAKRFGPCVWYFGENGMPLPHKPVHKATARDLLDELNGLFSESSLPQVILDRIEGDTAYVHISNDEQLTQQMGTTGATEYVKVITYTLCSLDAIGFVDIAFKQGDHALPGRYSR